MSEAAQAVSEEREIGDQKVDRAEEAEREANAEALKLEQQAREAEQKAGALDPKE
jgi:hypothetical protein